MSGSVRIEVPYAGYHTMNPVGGVGKGFLNRPLKNAICRVALHSSSLRRTLCTTHSSRFVRLAWHRFSPACTKLFQRAGRKPFSPTSFRRKRLCHNASSRPSPVKRGARRDPESPGFINFFWLPDLTAFVRNDVSEITTQPRKPESRRILKRFPDPPASVCWR